MQAQENTPSVNQVTVGILFDLGRKVSEIESEWARTRTIKGQESVAAFFHAKAVGLHTAINCVMGIEI